MADNRDDLIDTVLRGRMSPSDAEAEAQRLGLGPLSCKPPVAAWDPMREPFWTPVMVVAWIVWRTTEAVREAWGDYMGQCWIWRYRKWHSLKDDKTYVGFEFDRPEPPSLLTLLHVDADPHPFGEEPRTKHVNLTEARDEVLHALRAGRIQATRVPLASGETRREIAPFEWSDLIFDANAGDDRFTHKRGLEHHGCQHVLLPREEVMRLWKPVPPPTPKELLAVVHPLYLRSYPFIDDQHWRGGLDDAERSTASPAASPRGRTATRPISSSTMQVSVSFRGSARSAGGS